MAVGLKTCIQNSTQQGYPLISAIVSTYNAERFIRGCLEDLETQTIADKMEIIVIDSSSQEKEEIIVKEFQQGYDNVLYLRTERRETVYQAWNRAIKMAKGGYITNANTDDRRRKDCLEVLVKTLEENPDKAVAYGDSVVTHTGNETFDRCTAVDYLRWPDFARMTLLEKCFVGPHPVWRRSVHGEVGYFNESLKCAGDYEFWLRLAEKYEFIHIPELLGLYYLSEESLSRKGNLPRMEAVGLQRIYRKRYYKLFCRKPLSYSSNAEQRLKILYVVHEMPLKGVSGGTGIYILNLAHEMSGRGHDVAILYPNSLPDNAEYSITETIHNGIKAAGINIPAKTDIVLSIKNEILKRYFENYLLKEGFDLVHFNHLRYLSSCLIEAAKGFEIPTVLTLHDFWFLCSQIFLIDGRGQICDNPNSVDKCVSCVLDANGRGDRIDPQTKAMYYYYLAYRSGYHKYILGLLDLILAPSSFVKKRFMNSGFVQQDITVSPLGLKAFKPNKQTNRRKRGEKIKLLFIGNISELKGVNILIEAFSLMKDLHQRYDLSIYGRCLPEDKGRLQRVAERFPNIHFYGPYRPEDLPEIFSEHQVTIVPSLMESYSFVIRESFHAGVPVIASNVGGVPEVVSDGKNGLLFQSQDVKDLTAKMMLLIEKPDLIEKLKENIPQVKTIDEDAENLLASYLDCKKSLFNIER